MPLSADMNTTSIMEHGTRSQKTVPKADMSARYKNKARERLMQKNGTIYNKLH